MDFSSAVAFLILASTAISSASSSAAMRRRVCRRCGGDARTRASPDLTGGDVAFRLSSQEFCEQGLEPVDGLDPPAGKRFAPVGEHPVRIDPNDDVLGLRRDRQRICCVASEGGLLGVAWAGSRGGVRAAPDVPGGSRDAE